MAVALTLVLESGSVPTYDAVRELVQTPRPVLVPELTPAVVDLRVYDQLLEGRCAHG